MTLLYSHYGASEIWTPMVRKEPHSFRRDLWFGCCALARKKTTDDLDISSTWFLFVWQTPIFNGHFRNRFIGGTYHIYKAYFSGLIFREYPQKFWPKIWYIHVPPSVGSWRSPIEINAIVLLFLMGLFRNWLPKFWSLYLVANYPRIVVVG